MEAKALRSLICRIACRLICVGDYSAAFQIRVNGTVLALYPSGLGFIDIATNNMNLTFSLPSLTPWPLAEKEHPRLRRIATSLASVEAEGG